MTDPQQVLRVLQDAREIISDPDRWYQGGDYCDETGASVCSIGALNVGAGLHPRATDAATTEAEYALMDVVPSGDIANFNDTCTHAGILAKFDEAIANVSAQIEPTPQADACLSVMGACDAAGAVLASFICLEHPHMDEHEVAALASAELFYAAQDTARACSLGVTIERA